MVKIETLVHLVSAVRGTRWANYCNTNEKFHTLCDESNGNGIYLNFVSLWQGRSPYIAYKTTKSWYPIKCFWMVNTKSSTSTQSVVANGETTALVEVHSGIPQGAVLWSLVLLSYGQWSEQNLSTFIHLMYVLLRYPSPRYRERYERWVKWLKII